MAQPPRPCGEDEPCRSISASAKAASTSRGPTLPRLSTRSRIASTPSPSANSGRAGAGRSRHACGALDRPRRGGQQIARSARQTGSASRRNRGFVGDAVDAGLLAALGQHFDRAERRAPAGHAASNVAAIPRRWSLRPARIPSLRRRPSIPTARAKGNVIRGFGWNPSLKLSASPARRNSRSRHRIRSRCPISRRSPCLEKRIRTRNRTIRSTFPATAVAGGEPKTCVRFR